MARFLLPLPLLAIAAPFAAVAALLCLPPDARAQPLPELAQAALATDPAVLSAQAQLHAAEQRVVQARAALGPTVSVTASYNDTKFKEAPSFDLRPFWGRQLALQLTQPLVRPALVYGLSSAQAQVEQVRALVDQARSDALQRFLEAAFEVLRARDVLAFSQVQRDAIEEQRVAAERKYRAGTAPITDLREAEARADAVAAQLAAAEYELQLRQQVLSELVGRPVPALAQRGLGGDRLPPLRPAEATGWLTAAQTNNARVRQAQRATEVADAEVRRAEMAHAPSVDLTASHTMSADTGTITTFAPRRYDATQVGLSLNLPLFASGGLQARVHEAQALRDRAQADLDNARREATIGVRQQFTNTLSSMAQAQGFAAAVVSGEVAVRANQRGYEAGLRVTAEVLDAQSKLFDAQRQLSRARYDAWLGYAKLQALAGSLQEDDLQQLDVLLVPWVAPPPVAVPRAPRPPRDGSR